jgi:hypothetical protein
MSNKKESVESGQRRGNTRAPVEEQDTKYVSKQIRRKIGAQIKMDMQPYVDQYPNHKLMLINDLDGDVQRWLDAGAEPIPAKIEGRKVYAGLNDKVDNQWVKFVAGEGPSGAYHAYGLMMDPDLYDEYKLSPQRQRNEDIKTAMRSGVSEESGGSLPGGGRNQSYAPNLPIGGGKGYNEIRAK